MWETAGDVTKTTMDKKEICSKEGSTEGILMTMPPKLNWFKSRDMCRRFGGRLHLDHDNDSNRSVRMVETGETLRPDRCVRVWLGASDQEEEGVWRDSETLEILDMSPLWTPGQPNGARLQNCASIWEFVS